MGVRLRAVFVLALALALGACGGSGSRLREVCEDAFRDDQGGCSFGAIAGRATLEGESSFGGIRVLLDGRELATTDDAGSFAIPGVSPGTHTIELEADGFVSVRADGLNVRPLQVLEYGPVELRREGDGTSVISGWIFLSGASDHSGSVVRLDDQTLVTTTDATGAFRIGGVAAGEHRITASHAGFETGTAMASVRRGGDATLALVLERIPSPGRLEGFVRAKEGGHPLEGASIEIQGVGETSSGADGAYALDGVPAGVHRVTARLPGWDGAVAESVRLEAGATTVLDFALEPSVGKGRVSGTASRMGGRSHAGILVTVSAGTTRYEATTDEAGAWTVGEIPTGIYDVVASGPPLPDAAHRGFQVLVGENVVPTLVLGNAIPIDGRRAIEARVLGKVRKAILRFSGDDSTWLFGAETRSLQRVSDEPLSVLAVDPTERYATLRRSGALVRLDTRDGTLAQVSSGSLDTLISDGAFTLIRTNEGRLQSVRAGDLVATDWELPCPAYSLSTSSVIDESRGWRVILGGISCAGAGTFRMIVDFQEGWAAPPVAGIFFGADPATAASIGFLGVQADREVRWTNLRTRVSTPKPGSATAWRQQAGGGAFLYVSPGAVPEASDVWAMDVRTGGATLLLESVDRFEWMDDRTLTATSSRGGARTLHWARSSPPSSGEICSGELGFTNTSDGMMGCAVGMSLFVFDGATATTQVWATNSRGFSLQAAGSLTWWGQSSRLHARMRGRASEIAVDCSHVRGYSASNEPGVYLLRCSTGSWLLDFNDGAARSLGDPAIEMCEVGASAHLAICSRPSGSGSSFTVHDVRGGSSIALPESAAPGHRTAWSPFGDAVAFRYGNGGPAYHARFRGEGTIPDVRRCDAPATTQPIAARYGRSLWGDATGSRFCEEGGTAGISFEASPESGAVRVASSARYLLEGWLADLDEGTAVRVAPQTVSAVPYRAGLILASNEGLVRVASTGSAARLIGDAPVHVSTLHGQSVFEAERAIGYDLLVPDSNGDVATLLQGYTRSFPASGAELYVHDLDDSFRLSLLANDSWQVRPVPANPSSQAAYRLGLDHAIFHQRQGSGFVLHRVGFDDLAPQEIADGEADFIGAEGRGQWVFILDGWSWLEGDGGATAVLARASTNVVGSAPTAFVFNARAPDEAYWFEP